MALDNAHMFIFPGDLKRSSQIEIELHAK